MDQLDLDPTARYAPAHQLMDSLVLGPRRGEALTYLREYFGSEPYAGSRFHTFKGGGDRPAVANRIASSDLAALPLLGVPLRNPWMVFDLEEREDEISAALAGIPTDVAMQAASWSELGPGSPADTAYALLDACRGIDYVIAHKLLARKRPRLLPVYDGIVWQHLGRPKNAWRCIWTWLHGNRDRVDALSALSDEVDGIEEVALVRRLDVVVWMDGKLAAAAGAHGNGS